MATTDRVRLTKQELADLIDREAKQRLNMTGIEFAKQYLDGSLSDSLAARDIGMLVRLAKEKNGPSIYSRLHRLHKRVAKRYGHRKSVSSYRRR